MDDDDTKCIESGVCQILPQKDIAGRRIILFLPGLRQDVAVKHEARAKFFIIMTMLKEAAAQRMGVIAVVYAVDRHQDRKRGAGVTKFAQLASSAPIRWAGIHICCNDYREYVLLRVIVHVLPANAAVKCRPHFGTHIECRYALRGYGIAQGRFHCLKQMRNLCFFTTGIGANIRKT